MRVVRAIDATAAFQRLGKQGVGLGIFRLVNVQSGEGLDGIQRLKVIIAKAADLELKGLFKEGLGLRVVKHVEMVQTEVLHGVRDAWIFRSQLAGFDFEDRLHHVQSLGVPPLIGNDVAELLQNLGGFQIAGAAVNSAQFIRPTHLPLGFSPEPKMPIGIGDGPANRGFDQRLARKPFPHLRRGQQHPHLDIRIGFLHLRIGLRQQVCLQELVDGPGHGGLRIRTVTLLRRPYTLPDADAGCQDEHQKEGAGGHQSAAIAARELAGAVSNGRRDRGNRLVLQVPPNIRGEFRRRTIATRPIFFQSLQSDRVQVAANLPGECLRLGPALLSQSRRRGRILRADLGAWLRRVVLAQPPQEFVQSDSSQIEGWHTHQQLVKQDAERVDVGARINILTRRQGLFRAHILRSSDERSHAREHSVRGQLVGERLGYAEIDNLRCRPAIHLGDQNVRRFQVAVDDGFLMRVLDAFTNMLEEFQSFTNTEFVIIAVCRDRNTRDVLHHEVRRSLGSGAGVEHFSDGGVVHQGQSLAFGLEAGDHFAAVQTGFDQFERDAPAHGLLLLGQPDLAHAALADFLQQVIAANNGRGSLTGVQAPHAVLVDAGCDIRAEALFSRREPHARLESRRLQPGRVLHQRIVLVFEAEQRLHFPPDILVGAGFFEERRALIGRSLDRRQVQFFYVTPAIGSGTHLLSISGCMARASQTRAKVQSRRMVRMEIPITPAASSMLKPPKKRSSTARALRGSSLASDSSASSSAMTSRSRPGAAKYASSKEILPAEPPRFSVARLRAASTRMLRMIWAAIAKNWLRF